MCGIAGAFGADAVARSDRLTSAISHRGPDDAGHAPLADLSDCACGAFGHRRLAIIDLSPGGHQPMATPDGRLTIVFNGEIYNYRELKAELQREGVEFRTGSDTEVILAGWCRQGAAFLGRLRGMFALALWDARARRGWLARDPFGIKPLFYTQAGGSVLFASEIRALLSSGVVPRRLSRDAIATYLATGSVTEPLTAIEGIHALPAGTMAEIRLHAHGASLAAPVQFGRPILEPARTLEGDFTTAARMVRDALRDSVAHHLVADVPVGLFLSGGIDSSAVVALASEVATEPLQTFTVVFEEQEFSEEGPAAAVAKRFRTAHHTIPLRGADLLASLPAAFAAMDQPSLDGLNTYTVSQAVRKQGLKVVLSGLGGDELFAGYPSFRRARTLAPMWTPSTPFRAAARTLARTSGGISAEKIELLLAGHSPALAAYQASRALFGARGVQRLTGIVPDLEFALPQPPIGLTTLQQVSWYELTGYMRNTLLRDSDVFSMAHALELRVPFVDRCVADVSCQVDDAVKLRGTGSKPLLVAAVEDLLPREVWDRPKQGFTLPFAVWLRGTLAESVDRELSPAGFARVGIEPAAGRRIWDAFRTGRGGVSWSRVWALYTLARWARENDVAVERSAAQWTEASLAAG